MAKFYHILLHFPEKWEGRPNMPNARSIAVTLNEDSIGAKYWKPGSLASLFGSFLKDGRDFQWVLHRKHKGYPMNYVGLYYYGRGDQPSAWVNPPPYRLHLGTYDYIPAHVELVGTYAPYSEKEDTRWFYWRCLRVYQGLMRLR